MRPAILEIAIGGGPCGPGMSDLAPGHAHLMADVGDVDHCRLVVDRLASAYADGAPSFTVRTSRGEEIATFTLAMVTRARVYTVDTERRFSSPAPRTPSALDQKAAAAGGHHD